MLQPMSEMVILDRSWAWPVCTRTLTLEDYHTILARFNCDPPALFALNDQLRHRGWEWRGEVVGLPGRDWDIKDGLCVAVNPQEGCLAFIWDTQSAALCRIEHLYFSYFAGSPIMSDPLDALACAFVNALIARGEVLP